ncbi:hypothetical protein INR49_024279 [Caranx melampygus]|nr:hypothetical protein INR49_024279 [Caranx melampygus]
MRHSAVLILILQIIGAFSQIAHEVTRFVGCFENGTTEVQLGYDDEDILYVNFKKQELVYTVPKFLVLDPSQMVSGLHVYANALKAKRTCSGVIAFLTVEEKHPAEEQDPPDTVLYAAEDVQEGVENSLICFVNHFYPPTIKVDWTKNGRPVSEGVSLSRYHLNNDQTFHQFSTLTFTPREGDIYSCTVEHPALGRPTTRFWKPEFDHQSLTPDILFGVGLTVVLMGLAHSSTLFFLFESNANLHHFIF